MKRISAIEFIEKMRRAPAWSLMKNPYGEVELYVREEGGELEGYLGPDPLVGSMLDFMEFMFLVDDVSRPTKSVVNLFLPRLGTDEFFAKIASSYRWTTNRHKLENCVELVVLTNSAKIERYLSVDIFDMSKIEAETFLATLDSLEEENSD